jgi:hypothetical protein
VAGGEGDSLKEPAKSDRESAVILSAAKNLATFPLAARYFTAVSMTSLLMPPAILKLIEFRF